MQSKAIKTSVYLPEQAVEALKQMADKRGTTMAEVLRRAIATESFLDQTAEAGGEILVKKGKSVKQLVRF